MCRHERRSAESKWRSPYYSSSWQRFIKKINTKVTTAETRGTSRSTNRRPNSSGWMTNEQRSWSEVGFLINSWREVGPINIELTTSFICVGWERMILLPSLDFNGCKWLFSYWLQFDSIFRLKGYLLSNLSMDVRLNVGLCFFQFMMLPSRESKIDLMKGMIWIQINLISKY